MSDAKAWNKQPFGAPGPAPGLLSPLVPALRNETALYIAYVIWAYQGNKLIS
jgi:hypothetical protein